MGNRRYEWDEKKNQINIVKHGISLETATAVFNDPMFYEYFDNAHSGFNDYGDWENRYIAIGWVEKILYVVFTIRKRNSEEVYRMVSARKATVQERKLYEDWCKTF